MSLLHLENTNWRYPGVTALLGALALDAPAQAQGPPLRVMTYNIRYGTAADGDDAWPLRRGRTLAVVRDQAPDVLGVQEALRFQLHELLEAFPEYTMLGVGRDDGLAAGEHAALLYRRDRLAVDTSGTFWLSDTPAVPGSRSWGNRITRICTWARFRDRATGAAFAVFNVHLDHESQPSRERSVALILERMTAIAGAMPVLLIGDLNAGEDNPAVEALRSAEFADTFRVVHPDAAYVGTFNAFQGDSSGAKIDHVFARGGWKVSDAAIVRARPGGRDASDHFAVVAVLEPPPDKQ